jgi:lactate racemase
MRSFEKFQKQGFRVGPHKAFQIAREAGRVNLLLVSDLPHDLVRKFFFTPVDSLQQAYSAALTALPPKPRALLLCQVQPTPFHMTQESKCESSYSMV